MQRLITPFRFQSTAAEVAGGMDLTGKRIVITGGAAGIGLETARVLARAGAEITLAVRRLGAAQSVVLLAASPLLDGISSGRYFEDCNEAQQVAKRPTDFTGGYAAYAVDPSNAARLWDVSQRLLGNAG